MSAATTMFCHLVFRYGFITLIDNFTVGGIDLVEIHLIVIDEVYSVNHSTIVELGDM